MENKEMKQPIPVELDDDALEQAAGGTANGERAQKYCSKCGPGVSFEYRNDDWYCTICGEKWGGTFMMIA